MVPTQSPKASLLEPLREALLPWADKERSLFGARTFWVNGVACGYVDGDRVALRLPPDEAAALVRTGWAAYVKGGVEVAEPSALILFTVAESKSKMWLPLVRKAAEYCQSQSPALPTRTPKRPRPRPRP